MTHPILVTGAAGRVGGVGGLVVEALQRRGLPVRAMVRREDERAEGLSTASAYRFVGEGPRVSFARAGLTVSWDSKFQSLLELVEACDVPVRWSCQGGMCHTCECGLARNGVLAKAFPRRRAARFDAPCRFPARAARV